MRAPSILLALAALLAPAASAQAERSYMAGEYTIHYNAIPSTVLGADIARRYDLVRSSTRGLLNIAVLRQAGADADAVAVPARIRAVSQSLLGQRDTIELRELRDQEAIYYVGQFRIRGEERLRFELEVTPEGADRAIPVRFEHSFDAR